MVSSFYTPSWLTLKRNSCLPDPRRKWVSWRSHLRRPRLMSWESHAKGSQNGWTPTTTNAKTRLCNRRDIVLVKRIQKAWMSREEMKDECAVSHWVDLSITTYSVWPVFPYSVALICRDVIITLFCCCWLEWFTYPLLTHLLCISCFYRRSRLPPSLTEAILYGIW